MAVKKEATIARFIGLSTDEKPFIGQNINREGGSVYLVAANDLPAGSSFLESDTGRIFRWNGVEWTYPGLAEPVVNPFSELGSLIVSEMADMKEWMGKLATEIDAHPVFGDGIHVGRDNPLPVTSESIVQRHVLRVDISGAYAAGDVLAMPVELKGLVAKPGERILLQSARVMDKADQGAALDLVFFRQLPTVQALNAAWVVTDPEMEHFEDFLAITSGDYRNIGPNQVASVKNVNAILQCNQSCSLWLCTVTQGTPTYVAVDDLSVILAFLRL